MTADAFSREGEKWLRDENCLGNGTLGVFDRADLVALRNPVADDVRLADRIGRRAGSHLALPIGLGAGRDLAARLR